MLVSNIISAVYVVPDDCHKKQKYNCENVNLVLENQIKLRSELSLKKIEGGINDAGQIIDLQNA